jgi:hypothetical protein
MQNKSEKDNKRQKYGWRKERKGRKEEGRM